MIEKISPRMQKAFRDGVPPFYAADLWLSVNNGLIDTQDDFKSSVLQTHMDFNAKPGKARLAIQQAAYDIDQTTGGSTFAGGPLPYTTVHGVQKFSLSPGRSISKITVKVNNTGASGPCYVAIYKKDPYLSDQENSFVPNMNVFIGQPSSWEGLLFRRKKTVASGYNGEVLFTFAPFRLPEGNYWLAVSLQTGAIYYNPADVYAGGSLSKVVVVTYNPYSQSGIGSINWTKNIGDLYFKLELSGYYSSGRMKSAIMDLGEKPIAPGTFQMAYEKPLGTTLEVDLTGSDNADMSGGTVYENVEDGQEIVPYRYWQTDTSMNPTAGLDQTPILDLQEVLFPKGRIKIREKIGLAHVADDILRDYQALLQPLDFTTSSINLIDRVSTGGAASATLEDPTGEIVQKLISDSPLKNYRVQLYLGADVPGFSESDLLRFFIGSVQAAAYKPGYRGNKYTLPLTFKNPVLELKRKAPQPTQTGLLDFEVLAVNHDEWHVMDSMIDILRAKAGIPGRYVNLRSFTLAKTTIGDDNLGAPGFTIRRSNAAGLPDTRIKSPVEVVEMLKALATIADGYITADESSRIAFVKHDFSATPEAVWADEDMVRDGVDAVPIFGMDDCDLGYDKYLYNSVICGCEWDGDGDKWEDFGKVYGYVDDDSADDFGQGQDKFYSVMEKNLREPSKWLGPEEGYGGETLAAWITKKLASRFAYPPVVITGAVLPLGEFMRTQGSVVSIWSKRFTKFKRRGIALSETKKFMVLSKKLNGARDRCVFNLAELT